MSKENIELKKAGLKATLPRIRILEVLEQHKDDHLSAEDIYKELIRAGEDVGLATVYRAVSYTHLRAHETGRNLVCRLLLEKKK